jgi:hypothetical protein
VTEVVDEVAAAGRQAVLHGTHGVEGPPEETGRWGPSLILLPSGEVATRLDELTADVAAVLGDRHWPSGAAGRAHFTVRALEHHDPRPIPADRITRYTQAADRAVAAVGPVTLDVRGVVLTRGGVVATATSPDGSGGHLRRCLADELGRDGWLEDLAFPNGRDPFWYSTLLHFASTMDDADALVAWVDARRHLRIGTAVIDALTLCAWRFDGVAMKPLVLR